MRKLGLVLFLVATTAHAANTLKVVSAGPVGETATLAEANEIRAVFSEPMVVLGRIPQPVTAPFFRIEPAVKGTFRWSGTTTLVFTPDRPLPFATSFQVSIEASAKSVAGNTLDRPYLWSFTTPSLRLQQTFSYRRANGAMVIGLAFNQPVAAEKLLPRLTLRTKGHPIEVPAIPPAGAERMKRTDPQGLAAFEAKRAGAVAAAASEGRPVLSFLAAEWNKQRIPDVPNLIVIETKPGIAPDTWIEILVDDPIVRSERPGRGRAQSYVVEVPPTFFAAGMSCIAKCDPEQSNMLRFRSGPGVRFDEAIRAVSVADVTEAKEVPLVPKKVSRRWDYPASGYGLDELGYTLSPAPRYAVRVDPSLQADDGQKLGYPFVAVFDNWHKSAFVSFGSGHGVWESDGGSILPFHARNFRSVKQWVVPLTVEQLMPAMRRLRDQQFHLAPQGEPQTRRLDLPQDRIASVGLDLKPAIGDDQRGFAWAAIQPGEALPRSSVDNPKTVATLVQATNLGISVKDSPQNTLVLVTRLDDGRAVEGANVSIRDRDNRVFWSGRTDAAGLAIVPNTDLRRDPEKKADEWEGPWRAISEQHFIVVAEKDGDAAYVGSDWNEGLIPWEFGLNFDLNEADPLLRGTVFADRGVYKPGEEVHFKAIARADTPQGVRLLPQGTKLDVTLRDSQGKEIDTRTVELGAWSSADWTFRVPNEAPLGRYSLLATTAKPSAAGSSEKGAVGTINGDILVAAYRRPDFRVEAALASESAVAGTQLDGRISGRYLFGAPMAGLGVKWVYSKQELTDVPAQITDRYPGERWTFLGHDWSEGPPVTATIAEKEEKLDAKGELRLALETETAAGVPFEYRLEATVTDVTRQEISSRALLRVEAAPFFVGLADPPYFTEVEKGADTQVVAVGRDGLPVAGVDVTLELKRRQWTSVRQSEGDGFYSWQSERKEIPAGSWAVTTKADPVPLHMPLGEGGSYVLTAVAKDAEGRSTTTRLSFYVMGGGYTAWERYDHNRIDLVTEKQTYRPGETARILVKSPWETATALLTTEREGVRSWKRFELTSTQQTVEVPLTADDIPNLYVSVMLIKGRTKQDPGSDGSDPGKPAFRVGYLELKVEDASKRLAVDVKANRDEFRPAQKAKIEVAVRDAAGKPAQAEVTLWAVDFGVLSLTGYQPPEVAKTVYLEKALQVLTEDSRQRIVSRRVLTPKGATDGGGGGRDAGPGTLRKDFRVLAFWVGSIVTDAKGRARTEVTLPESLTTYRIMAVAADRRSRFGWDDAELRINKPVMLTPAWPRFLAAGDQAHFGAVVHSQLRRAGKAKVSIESLDPRVLAFQGATTRTVDVPANGNLEVRFDAEAKSIGNARVRMRLTMGRESDGFEDVIPVRVLVSPETVAASGQANPRAEETLRIPAGVVPGFGGLRVDLASTRLVGLGEGFQHLVEYPYGCAEQRASRSIALMLAADLAGAFHVAGIDPAKEKATVQSSLDELAKFQCGDGGFAFWPGGCNAPSPYLTSWVVHVLQSGAALGYRVDGTTLEQAYTFLENRLSEPPPVNDEWRTAYNAWQAFAVKTLFEGGRKADSHLERVYGYRERMPVFALAFLADALQARGDQTDARLAELRRRIANAILPEASTAHVEELNDPYLHWFWSSNVRSTAIVLGTLVRGGRDEEVAGRMVRWLLAQRKDGRWDDTQENAWALEAIVDYARRYESEVPDFVATVTLGSEGIARETFQGRSTEARTRQFSMEEVLRRGPANAALPVVFAREGTGALHYMMRLRDALDAARQEALDSGFRVERSYALLAGGPASTSFRAGDLIEVTLKIRATKERRFVAVTDPIPAGTEPVESWFATTSTRLREAQEGGTRGNSWTWWARGGWDHVERHDDRVNVFATRLEEGDHVFQYLVRATTAGTFVAAPTHAEEMYEPEVFGRTATAVVGVAK